MTFAATSANGQHAPIPAIRRTTIGRLKSTQKRTAASIKFCMSSVLGDIGAREFAVGDRLTKARRTVVISAFHGA
jgi:hypothetical protein